MPSLVGSEMCIRDSLTEGGGGALNLKYIYKATRLSRFRTEQTENYCRPLRIKDITDDMIPADEADEDENTFVHGSVRIEDLSAEMTTITEEDIDDLIQSASIYMVNSEEQEPLPLQQEDGTPDWWAERANADRIARAHLHATQQQQAAQEERANQWAAYQRPTPPSPSGNASQRGDAPASMAPTPALPTPNAPSASTPIATSGTAPTPATPNALGITAARVEQAMRRLNRGDLYDRTPSPSSRGDLWPSPQSAPPDLGHIDHADIDAEIVNQQNEREIRRAIRYREQAILRSARAQELPFDNTLHPFTPPYAWEARGDAPYVPAIFAHPRFAVQEPPTPAPMDPPMFGHY